MSDYLEALAELAALPRQLEEQIERDRRRVEAERARREGEIAAAAERHREVVARLEAVLEQARSEEVEVPPGTERAKPGPASSSDPVDYARQLVGRLEEALRSLRYTRDALAAEEAKLGDEERRRAAEERRRRERAELRREEQWERAHQGTVGLAIALALVFAAGFGCGFLGPTGVTAAAVIATLAGLGLAVGVPSTLPALALQRVGGSEPRQPVAPPREARLAAVGYAGAALGLVALGGAISAFAAVGPAAGFVALGLALVGLLTTLLVWLALPRTK